MEAVATPRGFQILREAARRPRSLAPVRPDGWGVATRLQAEAPHGHPEGFARQGQETAEATIPQVAPRGQLEAKTPPSHEAAATTHRSVGAPRSRDQDWAEPGATSQAPGSVLAGAEAERNWAP
jgi:hypothetical protein